MSMPTQNGPKQPGGWPPPPQTPPGMPGAPGMPGMPGMPYMPPAPPQPPRNGLGITGLVLGIVGLVLAMLPITFWLGGFLGLLALIFGILGRGRAKRGEATNRGMALAGVILGALSIVAALVWLTLVVAVIVEARDKGPIGHHGPSPSAPSVPGDQEEPSDGPGGTEDGEEGDGEDPWAAPARLPGSPQPLAWGQTYTYENGLKVTVGKPEVFEPEDLFGGYDTRYTALRVKVTVTNTTAETLPVSSYVEMADADGTDADDIGGDRRDMLFKTELTAGEEMSGTWAYQVLPEKGKTVSVTVLPHVVKGYAKTGWTGPVG